MKNGDLPRQAPDKHREFQTRPCLLGMQALRLVPGSHQLGKLPLEFGNWQSGEWQQPEDDISRQYGTITSGIYYAAVPTDMFTKTRSCFRRLASYEYLLGLTCGVPLERKQTGCTPMFALDCTRAMKETKGDFVVPEPMEVGDVLYAPLSSYTVH